MKTLMLTPKPRRRRGSEKASGNKDRQKIQQISGCAEIAYKDGGDDGQGVGEGGGGGSGGSGFWMVKAAAKAVAMIFWKF